VGRIIPKSNPKYDHTLDIGMTVPASRAQAADALVSGLSRKHIQIEDQTLERLVFSGRSLVGAKNIWITVDLRDAGGSTHISSRITKAHTAAWMYLFGIPIGPNKVRAIETYKNLSRLWLTNLGALGSAERS